VYPGSKIKYRLRPTEASSSGSTRNAHVQSPDLTHAANTPIPIPTTTTTDDASHRSLRMHRSLVGVVSFVSVHVLHDALGREIEREPDAGPIGAGSVPRSTRRPA